MLEFYNNKRIFVTGHTGFKGTWLCKILTMSGSKVRGYALEADTNPAIFNILNCEDEIDSIIGDIRNFDLLKKAISDFKPEIIFHLAAQPIVRESYKKPLYTYETNIMGTLNLLEAIRYCSSVKSVINITTDKVYKNNEWEYGYREIDELNGFDPYSNSKSCSELITSCYKKSFFYNNDISISTARAGNVIGGGDFSTDRIIPDCVRSAVNRKDIIVRNPESIRPYQHVLEALSGYLLIAEKQYNNKVLEGAYNIGPNDEGGVKTSVLVDLFCNYWKNIDWININNKSQLHEAKYLKLDCSKVKNKIGWEPKMNVEEAINLTVDWYKCFFKDKESIGKVTEKQIKNYFDNNCY